MLYYFRFTNCTYSKKEIKMAEIKETILDYVIDEYLDEEEDKEINYDTPLISSGIVDSFSMISLKRFLETKYNIQIPDSKATAEAFDTVNNIVKTVEEIKSE